MPTEDTVTPEGTIPFDLLRQYIKSKGQPEKEITDERLEAAWWSLSERYRFLLRVSLPAGEQLPVIVAEIARETGVSKSAVYGAIGRAQRGFWNRFKKTNPAIQRRAEAEAARAAKLAEMEEFLGGDALAARIANVLVSAQKLDVELLAGMTAEELLSKRNLGLASLSRVNEKLVAAGYNPLR